MLELIKNYEDKLNEIKREEKFLMNRLIALDKARQEYEHFLEKAIESLGKK